AAWEKAGAKAGWMRINQFGFVDIINSKESKPGDLPTFAFPSWKDGVLPKLPAPEGPFGLYLFRTPITDAGLKELTGLKQLQALYLGGTQVTDAGLKELAGLKQLQSLDLGETKITGAGLKQLAELKQLQSLGLGFTKITDAGLK